MFEHRGSHAGTAEAHLIVVGLRTDCFWLRTHHQSFAMTIAGRGGFFDMGPEAFGLQR
jgi:hypothetical protein